jgi:carbonic anhydrase
MKRIKPLPPYLVQRYHGWKATGYANNAAWHRHLAAEGQHPRAMVISCCDSRVQVTAILGADNGELFIHRNIANLVPPFKPDGAQHGTSAAIEYAVTALKVAHVIVLGHSNCGGVAGCAAMCRGEAPELDAKESFVGRWMDILRPKFHQVEPISDPDEQLRQLERQAVVVSLENLLTFPWVRDGLSSGTLSLHGLWTDIGEGGLEQYLPEEDIFVPV